MLEGICFRNTVTRCVSLNIHTNSFNKSNGFTETFKTISKQQTIQFLVKFLVSWVQSVLYRYMASIGNVLARTVWLGHPTSSISFVHIQNDVYIHVPMYHKVPQYTSTETNLFARNHHFNQRQKTMVMMWLCTHFNWQD